MKPTRGQKNVTAIYKLFAIFYPLWIIILPAWACKMSEVGQAMIHTVLRNYSDPIIEVAGIRDLAKANTPPFNR